MNKEGFFMYKKMLVIFAILTIGIFSFSVCFANNDGSMLQDAANGVRDAVGGAENAIEDGAKDIANTKVLQVQQKMQWRIRITVE